MANELARADCDFSVAPGVADTDWADGTAYVFNAADRSPASQGSGTGGCLDASAKLATLDDGSSPSIPAYIGPKATVQQATIPQTTNIWCRTDQSFAAAHHRPDHALGLQAGFGQLSGFASLAVMPASNALFAVPGVTQPPPAGGEWHNFVVKSDDEGTEVRMALEFLTHSMGGVPMQACDYRYYGTQATWNGITGLSEFGPIGLGSPGTFKIDTIDHDGVTAPTFGVHPADPGGLSVALNATNWWQYVYPSTVVGSQPTFTIAATDFPLDPTGNHLNLSGVTAQTNLANGSRVLRTGGSSTKRTMEIFYKLPAIAGILGSDLLRFRFYQVELGGTGVIGYDVGITFNIDGGGSLTSATWSVDRLGVAANVASGTLTTLGTTNQGDWVGIRVSVDRRNMLTLGTEFEISARRLTTPGPGDTGWNVEATPSDAAIGAGNSVYFERNLSFLSMVEISQDSSVPGGYSVRDMKITEEL